MRQLCCGRLGNNSVAIMGSPMVSIFTRRIIVKLFTKFTQIVLLSLLATESRAAEPQQTEQQKYIRVVKENDEPIALETAIVSYKKDKVQIDLVAVVHVGDRGYYRDLNREFKKYDVVCFEMIMPKDTNIGRKGKDKPPNIVNSLQELIRMTLRLEMQLECIDYTKDNFVHADFTPTEFKEAMEKQGDTPFTLFLSTLIVHTTSEV